MCVFMCERSWPVLDANMFVNFFLWIVLSASLLQNIWGGYD